MRRNLCNHNSFSRHLCTQIRIHLLTTCFLYDIAFISI
ncbi:hypothetical protein BMB171_C3376 [Bacillus thuringiensis BMB171]|nr:hypothetical protein BMB171_C3376 [Bacillus thuringiensis BMB171]